MLLHNIQQYSTILEIIKNVASQYSTIFNNIRNYQKCCFTIFNNIHNIQQYSQYSTIFLEI